MSRLYGSLQPSAGRRYYYALDGVPGIVSPATATLTLNGNQPVAVEPQTVFRNPATAILTLQGQLLASPSAVTPAQAVVTIAGQIPAELRSLTITPTNQPDYTEFPDLTPTLLLIYTATPGRAQLTLATLEINVTQGGNIGFVSPATAQLTLGTLQYTLLLLAGGAGVGSLTIVGQVPTLGTELVIAPDVGYVTCGALAPRLTLPFVWIDDDPAPVSTWITDAAA